MLSHFSEIQRRAEPGIYGWQAPGSHLDCPSAKGFKACFVYCISPCCWWLKMNIKVTSAKLISWKSGSMHKQIVCPLLPPVPLMERALSAPFSLCKKKVEGLDLSFSWQTRCQGFFPDFLSWTTIFPCSKWYQSILAQCQLPARKMKWSPRSEVKDQQTHFERICTTLKGYY